MASQLSALRRELSDATERAHRVATAVGDDWETRPAPKRWSVAECIDHLNATSRAYLPVLRDAVARGRTHGRPPRETYRRDLIGWLLCSSLEPPARMRFTTSPRFVPEVIRDRDVVLADFDRWQRDLIALLDDVANVDASAVKVASVFNDRIRYTLYSAYRILAVHERRHLWQAERVLQTLRRSRAVYVMDLEIR
jgi:hypothetical protein